MRWKETTYSGWGRAIKAHGEVARPEKVAALNAIMADAPAPAIGNRRSYGDTALNNGGQATDMTRLDRFLNFDFETGLLEAEAGATIGDILNTFGPKGWMPAVIPGTGFATLGGCIANDVHGKNHQIAGSFGQHVESILLVGAAGKPQRVSLKRNAPLFRATIGGLGQTGVILTARIRLAKCSGGTMAVQERRMADLDSFMDGFSESNAAYSVGWIDTTASGVNLGRGILEEANISTGEFSAPRKVRSIPFNAPGFLMSKPVIKLFNKLYMRRIPSDGRDRERPLNDFFFPLDRILNWNRLYGKHGFHQFQCVLPHDTARTKLTKLLEEISNSGLCSPLSVLKQLGAGRGGMMSFPMEGMTLAVDIANKRQAPALLARLNDIALSGKGRVYLAKDSSLDPAYLSGMNLELAHYRETVAKADPEAIFATSQSRRLNLRGDT